MPSNSRKLFRDKLLPDVQKLVETHQILSQPGRGRRALGHVTRSGVLMLCAAWELYAEEVAIESVKYLVRDISDPHNLPDDVKRKLAQAAKKEPHDHAACIA